MKGPPFPRDSRSGVSIADAACGFLAVVLLIPTALKAQSSRYTHSEVWPPFGQYDQVEASAINDAGDVCGHVAEFPFLFADGVMHQLPTLGGSFNFAYAINNHREIVGYSSRLDLTSEAVIWHPDLSMEILDVEGPGYRGSVTPTDISDSGIIVGWAIAGFPFERGWALYQGVTYDLGTINFSNVRPMAVSEQGVIAGRLKRWVDSEGDEYGINRGFLWRPDSGMKRINPLVGDASSRVMDMNDALDMVGSSDSRAMRVIEAGNPRFIGGIRKANTDAEAINNIGQIVGTTGSFRGDIGETNPFLFENGLMFDLTELLDDVPDADLYAAIDISNTGLILCTEKTGIADPRKAFILHPNENTDLRFGSLEPAVVDEVNSLEILGVTPNELVYLVISPPSRFEVCSEPVPGCPGVTVPSCHPRLLAKRRANETGRAVWTRYVSAAAADQIFWIQAFELSSCRTTVPAAIAFTRQP